MKIITFISAGVFIVLSAFLMKKENLTPPSLYDTKWLLKKIHTDTGVELVQTKAFIKFDQAKKSAGGNGSCNSFGSTAEVNENQVSFTHLFSTKMYCEEVQKTESTFFHQLGKATRFEIKGRTLLLYQEDYVLLEFASE